MPARILAPVLLGWFSGQVLAAEEGLLDLEVDHDSGAVILQLDELPAEFLYVAGLQSGAGSNDLGLDRGQLSRTRLVRFERFGDKVLLIEPNLAFRANTDHEPEYRAVNEAFAQSVLAGFEIIDPSAQPVSIDLAPLLLSDLPRISDRLAQLEQGEFTIDPERSAVATHEIRNFPGNALMPAILTFGGTSVGNFVSDVTPTPDSMSLRVIHQFIQLPPAGYQPRQFHPRSGYFALSYRDYAAPLDAPMDQRLIYRHRLAPGETLRYYVDNGTPEPIRSALLEGASWWREAFEEAGFENGFSVEVLPEDADPMDVRYNTIQWVHRATRGWSYGFSVSDPRTGEILKGHVSLGSLRVRQDQLIAEALTAPFTPENRQKTAARDMALARLRQLSAHEVGHTLGIDHNFAASFSGDASVMDYPHPKIYLDDTGHIRIDRAYDSGVSPWDKLTVRYGYGVFSAETENEALAEIIDEAQRTGIAFLGDQDARVPGSAHPGAHLWDNGSDVIGRLNELLAIRRIGLSNFSPAVITEQTPLFEMERKLVPVFLLHRYQTEATAKLLGGLHYAYTLRGDTESGKATVLAPVDAEVQENALLSLLRLLEPEALALPDTLKYLIPPPALEHSRDREFFIGKTGAPFDHLAPARAGANLVINELLQPQRLARLNDQNALDPELPDPAQVLDGLLSVSWLARSPEDRYLAAIQRQTNWLVLNGLMRLAGDASATDVIRATINAQLAALADELAKKPYRYDDQAVAARQAIMVYLQHPLEAILPPDPPPPGSPIG